MSKDIFSMTPNPERAQNILKQVAVRLEVLQTLDTSKYATLIIEGQYEVIKELQTALLAIDGYKTLSHTSLIEYLRDSYSKYFTELEIRSIDDLRKIRNRIAYEGFAIDQDVYKRKFPVAKSIITKLTDLVKKRL